eukprot:403333463
MDNTHLTRVQIDLDTSNNNVTEMTYMIPQVEDLDESTRAQKIYDLRDNNYHIGKEQKLDEQSLVNASENLFNQIKQRQSVTQLISNKSSACNYSLIDSMPPAIMQKSPQDNMYVQKQSLDQFKSINKDAKVYEYIQPQLLSNQSESNLMNNDMHCQSSNLIDPQIMCREMMSLKNPFSNDEDCFSDQVLIQSAERIVRESNSSQSLVSQVKCLNCQIEQAKHEQTKEALDKAIKLSNILMDEISKLDSKLSDCHKQLEQYKLSSFCQQDFTQFKESIISSNQTGQNKSSIDELKALTSLIKESRKSIHLADGMKMLKNPTILKSLSQSPSRFLNYHPLTAKNNNAINPQQILLGNQQNIMRELVNQAQEDRIINQDVRITQQNKIEGDMNQNIQKMMENMQGFRNRRVNADSVVRKANDVVNEILETSRQQYQFIKEKDTVGQKCLFRTQYLKSCKSNDKLTK